jgi:hypothetical protein
LVGQLDKLEAYLQGMEYAASARLPHPHTLASFRLDCEHVLTLPALRDLLVAAGNLDTDSASASRTADDR